MDKLKIDDFAPHTFIAVGLLAKALEGKLDNPPTAQHVPDDVHAALCKISVMFMTEGYLRGLSVSVKNHANAVEGIREFPYYEDNSE
jgi:hypothetical protein